MDSIFGNSHNKQTFIIAEVAQAHDGSLGAAHAYIDAAAKAGADAIKFQTHIAKAESSPQEPWRVKFSYQDETRYGYWKRMEFTEEQWVGLKKHADDKRLAFLSSPFSVEAAEMLHRIGVPAWKIASGEVTNRLLFDYIESTGLPILLSSGMSSLEEIDHLANQFLSKNYPFVLFQCTTAYPCPPEKIGLNMIPYLKERYGCPVGLSDHSGTIYPGLSAVALGASILEVHITFSKECFGPDVSSSLTTTELAQLVEGVRFTERMLAHPVNKDEMYNEVKPLRQLFTKSVAVNQDIPSGTILSKNLLALKKPGTGFPGERLNELLGKRVNRNLSAGDFILESDLE